MSSATIEASKRIVDETKRLYASLLTRPLDERQLARPPFKFIQDLVKSLITETRILRDVFNPSDFDTTKRGRQWDRRAKVDFVQRLIDFAANSKQPVANCVAARVVAGLEPNKTNELLQSLARVAQTKLSARDERRPRTFTRTSGGGASGPPQAASSSQSRRRSDSSSNQRAPRQVAVGLAPVSLSPEQGDRLPPSHSSTSESGGSHISPQKSTIAPGGGGSSHLRPRLSSGSGDGGDIATLASGQQQLGTRAATKRDERRDSGGAVLASSSQPQRGSRPSIDGRRSSGAAVATSASQQISSESDIVRGVTGLRSRLRALGATMQAVQETDDLLRDSLSLALKRVAAPSASMASV